MTPRAVLVTGASSGIGRALALALAREGYAVFGTVRDEAAASSLAETSGGTVTPLLLDVTDADQIAAAAEGIAAAVGERGLYALINNAGVDLPGPIETFPLDRLRQQLEVNVIGAVALTQALLPLLAAGGGRVVNIGSIGGRLAIPFNGPYAASKAALATLTAAWRMELRARGVAACLIEVGNVQTSVWEKALRSTAEQAAARDGAAAIYAPAVARMAQLTERLASSASDPAVVVHAVRRALTDRRPRAIYVAGRDAWLWRTIVTIVPGRLVEWGLCRSLGL